MLDPAFRAEGVAVFDVDRDGHLDLVTDQYWYRGPAFTPSEIRTPVVYETIYYSENHAAWGDDLDGDGWTDLVVAPFPEHAMVWYENPDGAAGHWPRHEIAPPLSAGMEAPAYVDLFGTGRRVLVMGIDATLELAWFAPGADPRAPWTAHSISGPGFPGAARYAHGLGAGDVDGDGRLDVITSTAWFAQTADPDAWVAHALPLGMDRCSTMFAIDLDGDGRADLPCARPHAYGLAWWRQQPDGGFVEHAIDDTISQMHALGLVDLDGDGAPELVSGKTWWAHAEGDPGSDDPALLVAYAVGPGPTFTRHDLDRDAGIGRQITAADVDADGKVDLVVTNKRGLSVLHQR